MVELASVNGQRRVALKDFYTGVRKTVMRADEVLVDIAFPAMKTSQRGAFVKTGLRRAQAISVVNAAVILDLERGRVKSAAITLGAVAPTIIHASQAEAWLTGKTLNAEIIAEAALLAQQEARPIDDLRGSAAYRSEMVRVAVLRGLRAILHGQEQAGMPSEPVLLWGTQTAFSTSDLPASHPKQPIQTKINGQMYTFTTGHEKTLLRLLREEAGLTGTKEGCAEGECGACTVYLDGKAVMACLVPAPRAHGAEIVTIEGLAKEEQLHPVQAAFVEAGAVQCGYCTPGFVMSAAKLLEERPHPSATKLYRPSRVTCAAVPAITRLSRPLKRQVGYRR
jgi:xanthine dehydrogenase iron-sulfur cluster and FAD-binding subunit A